MGSFVIWDERRTRPTGPILDLAKKKAAEQHQDVLVILNVREQLAQEIASFQGSIVESEDYYVYWVHAEKPETISSPGLPPDDHLNNLFATSSFLRAVKRSWHCLCRRSTPFLAQIPTQADLSDR